MKDIQDFAKNNQKTICIAFAIVLCFIYFLFLNTFYLCDYYVPDFRLYGDMAVANKKAADGFSSLFIWIAGISRFMPKFVALCCLFMLTATLFNFLLFFIRCFYTNATQYIFYTIMLFSTGTWYYFYGKIFYDFPFSVYTYSLCLLQMGEVILKTRQKKSVDKNWILFFGLSGLALSWKPYNVFMFAGLLLCALSNTEIREIVLSKVKCVRTDSYSFVSLVIGYLIGNFNFLVAPKETIKGIMAYRASFPFKEFMYNKNRIIWDHVNDLPFCISVFSLSTIFIIFVVVPLISKRKRYVAMFFFMFLLFRTFIKDHSPGYAWHGLTFGVFLITLLMFLFSEKHKFNKTAKVLLTVGMGIQMSVNFGLYIPTQIRWHNETQKSITALEKHNVEILVTVKDLIKNFDGQPFYIEQPVKRVKPLKMSNLHLRAINIKQPYIIYDDIKNCSPLESNNYYDWNKIYNLENSVQYKTNQFSFRDCTKYLIYIMPNAFKNLVDVAEVYCFEDLTLLKTIIHDEYTIYVYENKDIDF